jgi:glycine oxidase
VYVALDAEDEAVLERRRSWQVRAGYRVERLAAADVRRLEPAVSTDARSGLLFPDDRRVDNVRLMRAYAIACARRGVTLQASCVVRAVRVESGRAVGVQTDRGTIAAGAVVNAAGAWAAEVAPQEARLPIRTVRGQMVLLQGLSTPLRHAVYSRGVYLVPRRDGRLLAGSTYEEAGFDKRVTAEAVGGIVERTLRVAPALGDMTFAGSWVGLRPGTPDGLPIIGPDPNIAGLYHATGHYRSGILLAPITAQRMAELVLDDRTAADVAPLAPARFPVTPATTRNRRGRTPKAGMR